MCGSSRTCHRFIPRVSPVRPVRVTGALCSRLRWRTAGSLWCRLFLRGLMVLVASTAFSPDGMETMPAHRTSRCTFEVQRNIVPGPSFRQGLSGKP